MIDDFASPSRPSAKESVSPHILEQEGRKKFVPVQQPPTPMPTLAAEAAPDPVEASDPIPSPHPESEPNAPVSFWTKITRWVKSHRLLLLSIISGVLILGGGVAAYVAHRPSPSVKQYTKHTPKPVPPKPTTEPSRLTGVQVAPGLNKRPVTGIMIENSPDARPQAGLKDAGVVFEAIAEGGITRFLALFEEAQPDYIGPIRSARPYYLDWLLPFDASLAHVGGSPDALGLIKSLGVRDLDQFANGGSYHRIAERFAPHNVYTGMANLDALEASKGYTTSTFTGFPRKAEAPSKQPNATSIDFNISGFLYNAHYDYVAATNSYNRSEGGKPHVDDKSGTQLSPKVVIALVMGYGIAADGQHSEYSTIGSGPMYVFQDGIVTTGTWNKASSKQQFSFTDAAGAPLKLNPGQTWISMVGSAPAVTYK